MKRNLNWNIPISVLLGFSALSCLPQVHALPSFLSGSVKGGFEVSGSAGSGQVVNQVLSSAGDVNNLKVSSHIDAKMPEGVKITSDLKAESFGGDPSKDAKVVGSISKSHSQTIDSTAKVAGLRGTKSSPYLSEFATGEAGLHRGKIQTPALKPSPARSNPFKKLVQSRIFRKIMRFLKPNRLSRTPDDLARYAKRHEELNLALKTYTEARKIFKEVHQDLLKSSDSLLAESDPTRYPKGARSIQNERTAALFDTKVLSQKHGIFFDKVAETVAMEEAYIRKAVERNQALKRQYYKAQIFIKKADDSYKLALEKVTQVPQDSNSKILEPTWKSRLSPAVYMKDKMPGFEALYTWLKYSEDTADYHENVRQLVVNKARAFFGIHHDPTIQQKTWMQLLDEGISKAETQQIQSNVGEGLSPMKLKGSIELDLAKKYGSKGEEFQAEIRNVDQAEEDMKFADRKYRFLYNEIDNFPGAKMKDSFEDYKIHYDLALKSEKALETANNNIYEAVVSKLLANKRSGTNTVFDLQDKQGLQVLKVALLPLSQGKSHLDPAKARMIGKKAFIDEQAAKNPEIKKLQELAEIAKTTRDSNVKKLETLQTQPMPI